MGFAVAAAAARRGAEVTLIAGPVALDTPSRVRRIDVGTGRQMYDAVLAEFERVDALIMAAAVADFTPVSPHSSKLKRGDLADRFVVECEKNPDILLAAGKRKKQQVLVGFALETEHEVEHARAKLSAKHLDLIVANNPLVEGAAFGSDTNLVTILHADGRVDRLPLKSKGEVAHDILNRVLPLLRS
jgi:phosphopantothenoylcysteine decarboxylase/phosphopantothenate--cysteine ligase